MQPARDRHHQCVLRRFGSQVQRHCPAHKPAAPGIQHHGEVQGSSLRRSRLVDGASDIVFCGFKRTCGARSRPRHATESMAHPPLLVAIAQMSSMQPLRTTAARSALMKRVRRERTSPEQKVCKLLWSLGARYRRNVSDLPGTPDVANKSRRKAVFVHGCFWHFHDGCRSGRVPHRNRSFWATKLEGNRQRDRRKLRSLRALGYDVLVVWECEIACAEELRQRLRSFWFSV